MRTSIGANIWDLAFAILYAALAVQCARVAIEQFTKGSPRRVWVCFLGLGAFLAMDSYVWGRVFAEVKAHEQAVYPPGLVFLDVVGWGCAFVGVELLRHGVSAPAGRVFRAGLAMFGAYYVACGSYWALMYLLPGTEPLWTIYHTAAHPPLTSSWAAALLVVVFFSLGSVVWFAVARWIEGDNSADYRDSMRLTAGGLVLGAATYLAFLTNPGFLLLAGLGSAIWWCFAMTRCRAYRYGAQSTAKPSVSTVGES